jgi:hypothetical protein
MRGGLMIAALLVAGCAQGKPEAPPAAPAPEAPGARCDANAAAKLVGQSADRIAAEAQRLSGARTVRRYGSNDSVTMDYRPDRLNIQTDDKGVVVRFSCG